MPVLRTLLQFVLCVSLLLNGAGIAAASTAMDLAQLQAAVPDTPPAPSGCADHVPGEPAADASDPADDCCLPSECGLACGLHFAHLAVSRVTVSALRPNPPATRMPPAHAPPAVLHLIRPPIQAT